MTKRYEYCVNLDERGEFYADVRREETAETVFEIRGFEIFEDGFMKHKTDIVGLHEYLESLGIIERRAELVFA